MTNLFFGLTKLELRKAVFDYAEKKGIPHRFSKVNKLAGKDWLEGFMKRHHGISIRKPEATSINRIKAFNKVEVHRFYKNLEEVMSQYNFQADRIFNFDETGKNIVHKPKTIIAKKGMKRVVSATSGERGRNHTVACAVSAAGYYIPPMIIFPRVRMTASLMIDGPPGAIYKAHKSGWITEELFVEWLAHFKDKTNASCANPVLLILDNHSTHCSVEAFDFCVDNGIVMLSIPPHTSHRLQPLDLTIFGPLSTAFNDACDNQMKANGYMFY
ncbi:tigger transposable element-derived protein 6-like [Bradysia coprophila]|uniref:tigger transposable element-derived protein 6-like n=1 Tax=Bradysia coprophila TaxID=38358 RepID=UPI00187DB56E|nr:tigger transposable element-derived protein 6-like [Bradysia coprophila]